MAKRSSDTDFMIFLALAVAAIVGYLLYRRYEKDAAAKKKAVDTAPSVPDSRGRGDRTGQCHGQIWRAVACVILSSITHFHPRDHS